MNDPLPATPEGVHADFRYTAGLDYAVLDDRADTVPANGTCPRDPTDGNAGCGGKRANGTLGGDVVTDLIRVN